MKRFWWVLFSTCIWRHVTVVVDVCLDNWTPAVLSRSEFPSLICIAPCYTFSLAMGHQCLHVFPLYWAGSFEKYEKATISKVSSVTIYVNQRDGDYEILPLGSLSLSSLKGRSRTNGCKTTECKSTDFPLPHLVNVIYCVRVSLRTVKIFLAQH